MTSNRRKGRGKNMKGSGSIGSGGYGCVFLPALKCDNDDDNTNADIDNMDPRTKYVTKLLTNKHAETEFALIRKFDKRLRSIPDYANYFLVANVAKCRPGPLTKRDMHAYDKQCKPLIKKNITRKNINRSLHKVTSILIPYGGDTVDDFCLAHANDYPAMEGILSSLQDLLIRGILPMNGLGLFHGDIKSSNIMFYHGKSKLIDWGLAFDMTTFGSKNIKNSVDRMATYRPFQFNLPPSCILFNDEFSDAVNAFLLTQEPNQKPSRDDIVAFAAGFIGDWNQIRGEGSISIMNTIYGKLVPYASSKFDIPYAGNERSGAYMGRDDAVPAFAVHYIANILEKYIRGGEFYLEEYYHQEYLKNLDIWGFVISFTVLFNLLSSNSATLNASENNSLASLCKLFIHVLEHDSDPIDVTYISTLVGQMRDNYRTPS